MSQLLIFPREKSENTLRYNITLVTQQTKRPIKLMSKSDDSFGQLFGSTKVYTAEGELEDLKELKEALAYENISSMLRPE